MKPLYEFFKFEPYSGQAAYEAGKQIFDSAYEAACGIQDQMEEVSLAWGKQLPLPDPALQEAGSQWMSFMKNGREHLKEVLDQSYDAIGEFWGLAPVRESKNKTSPRKTTAKSGKKTGDKGTSSASPAKPAKKNTAETNDARKG